MTSPTPACSLSADALLASMPRALPDDMRHSTGDPHLDRITAFAARLCEVPISLVTLLDADHQHFLARTGVDGNCSGRRDSICATAMLGGDVLVVPDASADPRFAGSALVTGAPHIRFYAGAPVRDPAGNPLGALCVIDPTPRHGLTPLQRDGLLLLAEDVSLLLARQHRERVDADAAAARLAALSESEQRFRILADTMPQMVWSTQPDGYHDYYNARWYAFTGTPPGTTDGEGWNDMFHPEDQDRAWTVWRRSLETGEPYQIEYRLRHHDGGYRWVLGRALPMRDEGGAIVRWFGTCTDIDEQVRAAEEREVISQELSHRIKNIFSVIAGLISFAAKGNPGFADISRDLRARILALGRAHDFVRPHSNASRPSGGAATLHGMLEQLFLPYGAGRVTLSGPDLPIDDRSATPFALLFHELATNAAKYGALSVPEGTVAVVIATDATTLTIRWREAGGPPVAAVDAPPVAGFGTRLIEMAAVRQLAGRFERDWLREGLCCVVTVPLSALRRDG